MNNDGTSQVAAESIAAPATASSTPWWLRFPYLPIEFTVLLLSITLVPRVHGNAGLLASFIGAGAFLFGWTAVLAVSAKRRGQTLLVDLVPPQKSHYIQGSVQFLIYVYWAQYWPQISAQVPLILAQFIFFYPFDALLAWSRGKTWRLGFGPLPIVLSTNVFLCFRDDWFICQFLVMAVAALAKEYLRWKRDGRNTHIFNPSAFPLALFSLALLLTGTTQSTWAAQIADTFSQPPNMYVLIFCLGLIVQFFFSVTLMTFAAAATLTVLGLVYFQITGTYYFLFTNIPAPVFLGLHLLVTDPATSPRTRSGRVIFGVGYGLLTFCLYGLLSNLDQPTFYDKLLPIPLLNLSVKWIDRVAQHGIFARFDRWEGRFKPQRVNLAHMGAWGALFLWMLTTGFVQGHHPGNNYEFWQRAIAEGRRNADKGMLEYLKLQTRGGSAAAWNELGNVYLEGKIVAQDRKSALRYYAQASKLGSIFGSANLARLFLSASASSPDVDVDEPRVIAQAFDQLEEACGKDSDPAVCYLVGMAYETGRGRTVNKERAIAIFEKGCSRGNTDSCAELKRLHSR